MSRSQEITFWLDRLKQDSSTAAQVLWDAYFQKMAQIARKRLPLDCRQMADEEDAAVSAFKSFCRGVRQGRFGHLLHRDSLWALLVAMTINKAKHAARHGSRKKRGGDRKREAPWDNLLSKDPTPEFTVDLGEQIQLLLESVDKTGDQQLRPIVLWSLEGYTAEEIAARLDCVVRTVQRKLKIVRRIWLVSDE
jgi:RNA polymerase sigma factor (sigma-70 family)